MPRRDEDEMFDAFDAAPFMAEWSANHPTEESIYAWLDRALGGADSDAIERHVAACDTCAAAVAEARGYIAASARIMIAADITTRTVAPREHVPRITAPIVRRTTWRSFAQAAAAVVLVATGSYVAIRPEGGTNPSDGVSVVREPLSVAPVEANETTGAVQTANAPEARIGVRPRKPVARKERQAANVMRASEQERGALQQLPGVIVQAAKPAQQAQVSFTTVTVVPSDTFTFRTITGVVVDRATSIPISMANVQVPGTTLVANTDDKGTFILRDVPAAATTVQVRRLGYVATEVSLESIRGPGGAVNAELTTALLMLSDVVVASMPAGPSRAPNKRSCFVATADLSGSQVPMVRSISARQDSPGTYLVVISGWPTSNSATRGMLTMDARQVLRGSVQQESARLTIELTPSGEAWFSTVREHRGANIRSENVRYLRDRVSNDCR
ncbi:MAG: carboxypeptidase-like regulatory domain-containing protein [Phycisphaerae bacterium]|nr:carboxypeptidase-like regulatory domain-containing protein [Gemmatimonadaceae bacterium]